MRKLIFVFAQNNCTKCAALAGACSTAKHASFVSVVKLKKIGTVLFFTVFSHFCKNDNLRNRNFYTGRGVSKPSILEMGGVPPIFAKTRFYRVADPPKFGKCQGATFSFFNGVPPRGGWGCLKPKIWKLGGLKTQNLENPESGKSRNLKSSDALDGAHVQRSFWLLRFFTKSLLARNLRSGSALANVKKAKVILPGREDMSDALYFETSQSLVTLRCDGFAI